MLVILIRFPADTQQLPYDYATFCIWGAVEVNIAVVSGTLRPQLTPLSNMRLHTAKQVAAPFCAR